MRCLVRDAEDAGLADGCSLSALRSLQEQTFTDDIPLQLPRMRFWRPSVALAYFESGAQPKALPSHWRCISLTHGLTLSKQEEETRSSAIEWLAASGSSSQDHYTIRDGSVAFALGSPHPEWVDELRECGDRSCACYRLASGSSSASVREEFVRHIIQRTMTSLRGKPLRYVSIGCGALLTDAQILAGLMARGVQIESVTAVDASYVGACVGMAANADGDEELNLPADTSGHGNDNDNDDEEEEEEEETQEASRLRRVFKLRLLSSNQGLAALDQLARIVAPATGRAFCACAALVDACLRDPHKFGGANIFVQCDASAIDAGAAKLASSCALAPGGFAYALYNSNGHHDAEGSGDVMVGGHGGVAEASTACWQRVGDEEPLGGAAGGDVQAWVRDVLVVAEY